MSKVEITNTNSSVNITAPLIPLYIEKKLFKETYVNIYDYWYRKFYCSIGGFQTFSYKEKTKLKAIMKYVRTKERADRSKVEFKESVLISVYKDKDGLLWLMRDSLNVFTRMCSAKFDSFGKELSDEELIARFEKSKSQYVGQLSSDVSRYIKGL